jgi:hypothetical protein
MRHLEMIQSQNPDERAPIRDFLTFEDELPAEIVLGPAGARESATSFTEVKHETTDDN